MASLEFTSEDPSTAVSLTELDAMPLSDWMEFKQQNPEIADRMDVVRQIMEDTGCNEQVALMQLADIEAQEERRQDLIDLMSSFPYTFQRSKLEEKSLKELQALQAKDDERYLAEGDNLEASRHILDPAALGLKPEDLDPAHHLIFGNPEETRDH